MSALELIRWLTSAVFILVFAIVVVRAVRRPSRSTLDVALFFAAPALVLAESAITQLFGVKAPPELGIASIVLLLALPPLTLRAIEGITSIAWLVSSALIVGLPSPLSGGVTIFVLLYFVLAEGYAGVAVFRGTRHARGIVRARLQLIGAGTVLLALVFVVAGLAIVAPPLALLSQPLALLAGLAYLVGFAPPPVLRRAWAAPALHEFIRSTNRLAGERGIEEVRYGLADRAAAVLGTTTAGVGIWDEARKVLVYFTSRHDSVERSLDESLASRAFVEQRAIVEDEEKSGRRIPDAYRTRRLHVVLAAPMTVGDHRIGVVSAIAEREATFVEDDLELLRLVAEHAGVVLEGRRLLREVSGLNAVLETSLTDLRALNSEMESFSYAVSHDLRAPLRSIDGFSQILVEDKSEALGEDGRELLGRVRAAAARMGELIDDLLDLSRLSRHEIRPESVDLGRIATTVVAELRAREPARDVQVSIALDGDPAVGDPRLLRVVLTNLLTNAWKFTRERRPAHICVGSDRESNTTRFFVRDDGVGFDMKYVDKLFGAFQRLHPATEFEGTGIGLATVQRIIHRHGGSVWAEGEVGKGATFYFTLRPSSPGPSVSAEAQP
jgi:signal transduction histidine kinase